MDNTSTSAFSLHDAISLFLRKKSYFLLPFVVILGLVSAYAILATAEYRSEARILIEPQGLQPSDDDSVASFTEHRIQIISEQIKTRENIHEMIKVFKLYPELYLESPDKAVEKLEDAIELRPINTELVDPVSGRVRESTIAFLLAFEYTDPVVAKQVTDNLVSLFLSKNQESRTSRVEQNAGFLTEQADRLAKEVDEREKQLAAFKEKNAGKLPQLQDVNLQLIEKNERQLLEVSEDLRSLREQAIFVEAELRQTSKTGMLISSTGERILTNSEKIKALQTELADARRRYSSSHPDVKRLERQLEEAHAGLNNEDAEFYAADANAPDNPAYIQLESKLKSLNSEIGAMSRRESALRQKIADYEKTLTQSPEIEREYLALTRDYENVLDKYRETKQRVLQAQLSEAAEKGDQNDRFTILETPRVEKDPVRPNRLAIMVIGTLLALLSGAGAVIVADQLDRTVRNSRDLSALIDGPPLGVIGYIELGSDVWRKRVLASLLLMLIVAGGATGYFIYKSKADDVESIISMSAGDTSIMAEQQ
ncbi:MAG: hypothetical protein KDJ38_08470 [Gammaproteobacteria bacterium]|nr:hypothetical protein [Gammaproteobacteria bacterium]